jgi:hypothetical protein
VIGDRFYISHDAERLFYFQRAVKVQDPSNEESGSDNNDTEPKLRVVVFLDLKTLKEKARFNLPESLNIEPSTLKDAALFNDCTMLYMDVEIDDERKFVFYDI